MSEFKDDLFAPIYNFNQLVYVVIEVDDNPRNYRIHPLAQVRVHGAFYTLADATLFTQLNNLPRTNIYRCPLNQSPMRL